MNRIEAVIFDWAGTTVDFGCMAPVAAFVDAFADYGLAVTLAETREPMGTAKRDHISTMLAMPRISELFRQHHGRDHTEADIDALYIDFEKKLMANLSRHTDPKPHVLPTIAALREAGIKIGSTTGYNRAMMEVVVPAAAAKGYAPDCWFCAEDVNKHGRPYPYMLFAAMQKMHVKAVADVIKVGDTAADIEEGIAAGVWTVGVVEGSSEMGLTEQEYQALNAAEQDDLKEKVAEAFWCYGADFVIDNISEIFDVIRLIETDLEEELDD